MIFILRILSDIFWNIKFVNVLTNLILVILIFYIGIYTKKRVSKKSVFPLVILTSLTVLMSISLSKIVEEASMIIYFKIVFSFLMFLYGVLYNKNIYKLVKNIEVLSVVAIIFNFIISFFSFSYQYWGNVKTFTGLYYFKTDMALATVIFLSFVSVSRSIDLKYKIMLSMISFYTVYITNARIHLLSIFMIISLMFLGHKVFINFGKKLVIMLPIFLISFLGVVLVLNNIATDDSLKIDLFSEDAYSDSNLQGRNEIWEILIGQYMQSDNSSKIMGLGLNADMHLTERYMHDNSVHNAHNGFLYFLIATGIIGFILFLLFVLIVAKNLLNVTKYYNNIYKPVQKDIYVILCLFVTQFVIFVASNLTSASIIYQQQTWFFMFFAGYMFNLDFINIYKDNGKYFNWNLKESQEKLVQL